MQEQETQTKGSESRLSSQAKLVRRFLKEARLLASEFLSQNGTSSRQYIVVSKCTIWQEAQTVGCMAVIWRAIAVIQLWPWTAQPALSWIKLRSPTSSSAQLHIQSRRCYEAGAVIHYCPIMLVLFSMGMMVIMGYHTTGRCLQTDALC